MNGTWYNLPMLSWLWLLPVLLVILWLAAWRVRRQLNRWLPPQLRPALTAQVSGGRRWCANFLWLLALALLVIALARPAWHAIPQDVHSSGRDVVFLLDVSKSMLAEDLKPNRLERAKLAIDDCVNVLNGDRVALVVFAGGMVVKCPLTQDYGFFRMMLTDVSTDSVSRGGTLIGDALRKIRKEVFDGVERKYRDIVLITDGEDHESFPQQAAEELGKEGIRLLAVGLGDEAAGSSIMVPSEQGARSVLRYHGEVIKTKLDSRTLRNMASATPGGRYLPVGTGNFDLGQIYKDLIATAERRELESQTLERYEEKFQIFLGAGMILLALSLFLGDRRSVKAMAGGILLLFCLVPGRLVAAEDAEKSLPDSPYECYNLALESYRRGEFQAAKEQFQAAADKAANLPRADRKLEAKCRLGAGNASYRLATGVQSEPGSAAAELKEGIDDYARAEELSPDLAVVKENKRVARLVWKKLLQQQRQQQQQQAQQRQQQKNDLDNLAKRQEQAAEQSSQAGDDKQKQQQAEQQQEQLNQDTEKMAQQTADNQAVQEKIQEAQEHQQKAMEKMKEQKMEEAAEEQRQAARSLQEAGEESQKEEQQKSDDSGEEKQGEDQQQAQGQEQQGQEQQQQQAGQEKDDKQQEESREQGELSEDAQDILEEERKARRLRVLPRQGQIKEVDKDW